jgi:hypothetical protein
MALLDDLLSTLNFVTPARSSSAPASNFRGEAGSGLSGIANAGNRAMGEQEQALAILSRMSGQQKMELFGGPSGEYMSLEEEAADPRTGTANRIVYTMSKMMPAEDSIRVEELPNPMPRPPVDVQPLSPAPVGVQPPALDEDAMASAAREFGQRGVNALSLEEQRRRDQPAPLDDSNMSAAERVQARVRAGMSQQLNGTPQDGGIRDATDVALTVGTAPELGIKQVYETMNYLEEVDPVLASQVKSGTYDAAGTGMSLASLALGNPAFLVRFLPSLARVPGLARVMAYARSPEDAARFVAATARSNPGVVAEIEQVIAQQVTQAHRRLGSTGAARQTLARQGTELDPRRFGPGNPMGMARGGKIRQSILNRYGRMI